MKLTNRLLAFFVGTLAIVLAGFSIGVYLLVRQHLEHRLHDQLDAALRTLVAAAEVSPDGAEWEPAERATLFNPGDGVVWQVWDDRGQLLDGSPGTDDMLPALGIKETSESAPVRRLDRKGQRWLATFQRIRPTRLRPGGPIPGRHSELTVAAAVPEGLVGETLSELILILAGLSLAVLIFGVAGGYLVCAKALAPVSRMASAARGIGAANFDERLPVTPANDELADLGQSFNGLLDRLHESFERQRRFTGDASHQLRTPLAAILGQAEVALRRDRPVEEYRQALASVQRQASHLTRIVEALLFLARVDADAGPPPAERLDLAAWLPEHLRTWAEHPRADDLRLLNEDGSAVVQVPPALLGELVNNLIDNALKYSEPGSPVTIRLGQESGMVALTIEDKGCGMALAEQAGLFRPFFRSADARRRGIPGVGLGLAVAARLAKAFGGDITVTSEPERGSCFRVTLPAV